MKFSYFNLKGICALVVVVVVAVHMCTMVLFLASPLLTTITLEFGISLSADAFNHNIVTLLKY